MTVYVVRVPSDGFDENDEDLIFVFTDEDKAQQFAHHVRELYGIGDVTTFASSIDTYDSAIEALVEAVGPSDD